MSLSIQRIISALPQKPSLNDELNYALAKRFNDTFPTSQMESACDPHMLISGSEASVAAEQTFMNSTIDPAMYKGWYL